MVKVVVLDEVTHRRLKVWASGLGITSGALVKRLVFQSEVPAMMRDTSGEEPAPLPAETAVPAPASPASRLPATIKARAWSGPFSKASQVKR